MDADSVVARLTSTELYGANPRITTATQSERDPDLAAPVNAEGDFHGISLDPTSHFRQVLVFFDERADPVPLVGGEILRARFRRVRVAPFHRVTWEVGTVTSGLFTTTPPLNNQVLAVRLYFRPPGQSHVELPPTLQFTQELLASGSSLPSGIGQPLLYHLYAPGATSLLFFGGVHGDASAQATTLTLRAPHPERPRADTLSTSVATSVFGTVLGTLAIGPGTLSPATLVLTHPGFVEYYVDAGPTTTPGTYTIELGLVVNYA